MTTVYIWPDGSYAETDDQLQEILRHKSDDYATIELDETFDLEEQLCGDSNAGPLDNQTP